MDEQVNVWLYDILQSIEEVESYFSNSSKEFDAYVNDIKTKRAVERDIEIIGEAVNRIVKHNPNFKLENARNIIGTRNRIIHGYDSISDEMIWSIVINHLPKLKIEIKTLLKE
jgi:uncharacterized protein with HEPN domain